MNEEVVEKPRLEAVPPKPLAIGGITRQQFDEWKDQLVDFLIIQEDSDLFLPGGIYSAWLPLAETKGDQRIRTLHINDPESIENRNNNESNENQVENNDTTNDAIDTTNHIDTNDTTNDISTHDNTNIKDSNTILKKRNDQLSTFLSRVCDLTSSLVHNSVTNCSTSFDMIIEILLDFHGLKRRNQNIFDVSDVQYSANEDFNAFYVKFRATICDNLRKQGDQIEFLSSDKDLLEDEILSPTFEEVIVLWSLEKIDTRLPGQVKQAFGERVIGNVTLKDLQKEIFQYLPVLVEKNRKISKEEDSLLHGLDFVVNPEIKEEFELQPDEILESKENGFDQDDDYEPNDSMEDKPEDDNLDNHDDSSFDCDICNKTFSTSLKLYYHKRNHKPKKYEPSKCEKCSKTFNTKLQLIQHRSKFHKVEQKCHVCDEVFMNKIKFYQHIKEHKEKGEIQDKKMVHTCAICKQTFDQKKKLIMHRSQNHRIQQNCDICDVTFSNKVKFYRHMKEHDDAGELESGAEALLCRTCWKTSFTKAEYEDHCKTHQEKENKKKDPDYDLGEENHEDDPEQEDTPDNKSDLKPFGCNVCNKTYSTSVKLHYHKRTHRPKKFEISVCEHCNESFPTKKHLIAHRSKFHKVEQQCEVCLMSFMNKIKYWQHMREHKEKGEMKPSSEEHICEICNKSFDQKKKLNQHMSTNHRIDQHCEVCSSVFSNKIKFYQHMQEHEEKGERSVEAHLCLVCWRTQTSKDRHEDHMVRYHRDSEKTKEMVAGAKLAVENGGGNPGSALLNPALKDDTDDIKNEINGAADLDNKESIHMCDSCGKELSSIKDLAKHKKWHDDQENTTCPKCELQFDDKISYRSHMRTHRSDNPQQKNFTCENCGQSFVSRFSLRKHNKIHEGGKLRCETCHRSFYFEKDMNAHVCKHFACEICSMKFIRAKNLTLHKRMHAGEMILQCDMCEGLFDTKRKLNDHRRAIHILGKKYKCDVCPKAFIGKTLLEKHKRSHTGERPYKCSTCGAGFTQKENLNTHFLLHTKENPFPCVGCQTGFRTSGELKRHREKMMCGFDQSDLFKNKL